MKKILMAAGIIALGVFFSFGYLLYKVGEEMEMMYRCGCHTRDY